MQFCVHNQKGIIKLLKNNGLMGTVFFFQVWVITKQSVEVNFIVRDSELLLKMQDVNFILVSLYL